MNNFVCPLCGGKNLVESWLKLSFKKNQFTYLDCTECHSLICNPMPDEDLLRQMYDETYAELCTDDGGVSDSLKKFTQVLDYVKTLEKGVFIDYGCGDGKLLKRIQTMNFDVLGIEFNPDFAAELKKDGIRVIGHTEEPPYQADVLHLGDVLEHLTNLEVQFPQILKLLKKGGYLIAHGPLEGNPNFFYQMLKLGKKIKRNKVTEMAPFHVILATGKGQRDLFERFDLEEKEFQVDEVAFPAAESLSAGDLTDIRKTGLFLVRKVSQITSSFDMKNLGNRYFYVGKK